MSFTGRSAIAWFETSRVEGSQMHRAWWVR